MIAFVQPFGIETRGGGGARILRALIADAPQPLISICTSLDQPPVMTNSREIHLPIRPSLGRIENTRFNRFAWLAAPLSAGRFRRQLAATLEANDVKVVHAIPHGVEFWHAFQVAQQMKIGYVLNVHDELDYNLHRRPDLAAAKRALATVWREADARIVISDAMGEEYCRRYGERPFSVVTDGLTQIPNEPAVRTPNQLRLYFMGLFHRSYEANLTALRGALAKVREKRPTLNLSATFRSGSLPSTDISGGFAINVLPLGSEQDVADDMTRADLLYLPLPFGEEHQSFVKYSLSTKMVSYLGSGLPILYHGPSNAAAARLLAEYKAAIQVGSLDADVLTDAIISAVDAPATRASNALSLARKRFNLDDQRRLFWNIIAGAAAHRAAHANSTPESAATGQFELTQTGAAS